MSDCNVVTIGTPNDGVVTIGAPVCDVQYYTAEMMALLEQVYLYIYAAGGADGVPVLGVTKFSVNDTDYYLFTATQEASGQTFFFFNRASGVFQWLNAPVSSRALTGEAAWEEMSNAYEDAMSGKTPIFITDEDEAENLIELINACAGQIIEVTNYE